MNAAGEALIELGQPSDQVPLDAASGWSRGGWRGPLAVATVVLMSLLTGAEPGTGYRPPPGIALPLGSVRMIGDTAIVVADGRVEAVELPRMVVRWRSPAAINSFVRDVAGNLVVISQRTSSIALRGQAYTVALDLATGLEVWKHAGEVVLSRPDQRLMVFHDGATIAAVDVDSGGERWSEPVGADSVLINPQRPGDPLAIIAPDGRVRLLQPETGGASAPNGRVERGAFSGWTSDGVMVVNFYGGVVVGRRNAANPGSGSVVVAYDLATLTELWRHDLDQKPLPEAFPWSPIVALRDGDSLEGLEPRTGQRRWRRDLQPESLVQLPGGDTVLVGREVALNGLLGPAELYSVADGAAIATTGMWRVVGIHNGRLLVVRGAADAQLRTWLGSVDLNAGSVVAIDWLAGLDPGADCRVEGEWLLCANPPTRTMLLFRL